MKCQLIENGIIDKQMTYDEYLNSEKVKEQKGALA